MISNRVLNEILDALACLGMNAEQLQRIVNAANSDAETPPPTSDGLGPGTADNAGGSSAGE